MIPIFIKPFIKFFLFTKISYIFNEFNKSYTEFNYVGISIAKIIEFAEVIILRMAGTIAYFSNLHYFTANLLRNNTYRPIGIF